jgi:ribosomal protein S18 acetylase RimI-like enzyme
MRRFMRIRQFQSADESVVVALWGECGLTRPWNDPHKDIARKLAVQPELFLVGVLNETVIATVMAGYEGHRGWVNYLGVAPAFRGRGFARKLMTHVEQLLLHRGCPKVSLLVRSSNPEAIALYRHLGTSRTTPSALGNGSSPTSPLELNGKSGSDPEVSPDLSF